MRYKVGDKVRIKEKNAMHVDKLPFKGKVMTVVLADKIGKMYRMKEDNRLSPWFDEDIEEIVDAEPITAGDFRPNYYGGAENVYETRKFINAHNLNFNLGNVVKYVVRAGKKDDNTVVQDINKAMTYLQFELERISDDK